MQGRVSYTLLFVPSWFVFYSWVGSKDQLQKMDWKRCYCRALSRQWVLQKLPAIGHLHIKIFLSLYLSDHLKGNRNKENLLKQTSCSWLIHAQTAKRKILPCRKVVGYVRWLSVQFGDKVHIIVCHSALISPHLSSSCYSTEGELSSKDTHPWTSLVTFFRHETVQRTSLAKYWHPCYCKNFGGGTQGYLNQLRLAETQPLALR